MLRKLIEVKFHYDEMQYFQTVLLLKAYLIMNLLFDIKFPVSRIRVKFELMPSFSNSLEWKKKKKEKKNALNSAKQKGKRLLSSLCSTLEREIFSCHRFPFITFPSSLNSPALLSLLSLPFSFGKILNT